MLVKAVVMPGFSQLIIVINPTREVTRQGLISVVMPWLYAPWPEAKEKGISETQIEGETLRDLLTGLATRYGAANVDFQPVNPATCDLDFDYDVSVNGAGYLSLDGGLDTKLQIDDTVKIDMLWRWDG
jgi:hypothetical protein